MLQIRNSDTPPAVRIGLHRGKGAISGLIRLQTRSSYSHASLVLPDWHLIESLQGRGVINTRWLHQLPEPVDIFEVPASDEILGGARQWALKQLGKGYDYTMVARFISRRQETRSTTKKWFCSELVFAAFQHGCGIDLLARTDAWEVSPELLNKSTHLVLTGTYHDGVFIPREDPTE